MTLPNLQLAEPLVSAMVTLLEASLPGVIDSLNATVTDGFTVDKPAQYLPYMPFAGSLQGGLPIVAVQQLGGQFEDDLQYNTDAEHQYAVIPIIQNADHQTLAWQLNRTLEAIAYTIQQDRLVGVPQGSASVMKTEGGAWSVNFVRYEPGPLLGDIDPENPGSPPATYLSWVGLVLSSKRREVG